jgi:hypothetical protein
MRRNALTLINAAARRNPHFPSIEPLPDTRAGADARGRP